MKQYLLSIHQPTGSMPPPEFLAEVTAELAALREELAAAGAWVFGNALHDPDTATVVRPQAHGGVLVTDGPYAEGKEHLGGIMVIEVADLDVALAWARRYAAATTLPVEVRPFRG
ncbi:YciI family protein [Yinghuangia soli]|uniref:YciI family protein n=1 Tax=Yinghuangia soli TaxID=2908204 RepID=A0AA41PYE7_9ACTN|nr:YciI family protein [Yinghuangia soli]MCF2527887.1 YciI family protein [Yinghuangia soli]